MLEAAGSRDGEGAELVGRQEGRKSGARVRGREKGATQTSGRGAEKRTKTDTNIYFRELEKERQRCTIKEETEEKHEEAED